VEDAAIYEALNEVFRETFGDDSIAVSAETTAKDIEDWDSMMQVNLIVAIEARFGMRFTTSEVESLRRVGDIVLIVKKKSPRV
jgi:acyl carrier protein